METANVESGSATRRVQDVKGAPREGWSVTVTFSPCGGITVSRRVGDWQGLSSRRLRQALCLSAPLDEMVLPSKGRQAVQIYRRRSLAPRQDLERMCCRQPALHAPQRLRLGILLRLHHQSRRQMPYCGCSTNVSRQKTPWRSMLIAYPSPDHGPPSIVRHRGPVLAPALLPTAFRAQRSAYPCLRRYSGIHE